MGVQEVVSLVQAEYPCLGAELVEVEIAIPEQAQRQEGVPNSIPRAELTQVRVIDQSNRDEEKHQSGSFPHVAPSVMLSEPHLNSCCGTVLKVRKRNVRANPQVSLTIDTREAPYRGVVLRGRARELPFDDALHRRVAVRYLGEEGGQAYVAMTAGAAAQSVLLEITVESRFTWDYGKGF